MAEKISRFSGRFDAIEVQLDFTRVVPFKSTESERQARGRSGNALHRFYNG